MTVKSLAYVCEGMGASMHVYLCFVHKCLLLGYNKPTPTLFTVFVFGLFTDKSMLSICELMVCLCEWEF